MKAADLDHLDVFKPPIMELIDIYADGDPSVVNDLARRVLKASPCSIPTSASEDEIAASQPEEARRAEIHPAISENPVALDEGVPASAQADVAAPDDELDAAGIDTIPVSAEEVQTVVLGGAFAPSEEMPVIASEYCPAPVEEPHAVFSDDPPVRDEEIRAVATKTSPAPTQEIRIGDPNASFVQDENLPVGKVGVAAAVEPIAASEPEHALVFATSDDLIIAATPSTTAVETLVANAREDRFRSNAHEESGVPTKKRSRTWPRIAAFSFVAALAVAALVVGFRTGLLRSAGNLHLQTYVQIYVEPYIATFRQFVQDLTHPSPTSDGTSVQVAKDSAAQPLRTATKESSPGLLLEADPTDLRNATVVKIEEPVAKSLPPKAQSPVVAPPVPSPPAVVVLTPPAVSVPEPPSGGAPAVTIVESPPPLPVPSPPAAAKPIAPSKRDTAALPALVGPGVQAPARTPPSADSGLLMTRGDQLLASGDIIAARHYFELVAEAGDLRAALRLGKTYDPAFLKQIGARGITGNPAMAKSWYLKAIASGDKDADMRLLQLMALYPE